jgi:hypothetical protein
MQCRIILVVIDFIKFLILVKNFMFDINKKNLSYFFICLQNTSKLIQSDQWSSLDEAAIMKIYNQVPWLVFY